MDPKQQKRGAQCNAVDLKKVSLLLMVIIIFMVKGIRRWRSIGGAAMQVRQRWGGEETWKKNILLHPRRGGKSAAQQLPIKFLTRCIPRSDLLQNEAEQEWWLHCQQMFYSQFCNEQERLCNSNETTRTKVWWLDCKLKFMSRVSLWFFFDSMYCSGHYSI